ncbi:MAG: ABC transporter ATP-binding protein [archaeon GB-1867-035]|nr:ABC transporter ATP-binding protein [Candidatus Culexmicrobium profundum]
MSNPIAVFNDVSKFYSGRLGIDGISFRVNYGEIVGCIGPNGAGKTTISKLMAGLLKPTRGMVKVFSENPFNNVNIKFRIGLLLDFDSMYDELTVYDNLLFLSRVYNLDAGRSKLKDLLRQVGLENELDTIVGKLSKGMRRRLSFVGALIHNPELLILDEPLVFLDLTWQERIKRLIKSLRDEGKTIFITSNDLVLIDDLAEKIILLDKGRLVIQGVKSEIKEMLSRGVVKVTFFDEENFVLAVNAFKSNALSFWVNKEKLEIFVDSHPNKIAEILMRVNCRFKSIGVEESSLEEVYRKFVSE